MNFIEGRCPGSKAMDFSNGDSSATFSNVNIGYCDYTIAFWIRLLFQPVFYRSGVIVGSSRSGRFIMVYLDINSGFSVYVGVIRSTYPAMFFSLNSIDMHSWTHIALTCEQDNKLKMFFNGEITPISSIGATCIKPIIHKKTFHIGDGYGLEGFSDSIMDLHILGFALAPDEIFNLYRGQQFFEMSFLSYEKME